MSSTRALTWLTNLCTSGGYQALQGVRALTNVKVIARKMHYPIFCFNLLKKPTFSHTIWALWPLLGQRNQGISNKTKPPAPTLTNIKYISFNLLLACRNCVYFIYSFKRSEGSEQGLCLTNGIMPNVYLPELEGEKGEGGRKEKGGGKLDQQPLPRSVWAQLQPGRKKSRWADLPKFF